MAAAICPFLADQTGIGSTYTYAGRGTTRFISNVGAVERLTAAVYSGWSTDSEQEEPVGFLSRAFGVQPLRPARGAGSTRPGDPGQRWSAFAGEPVLFGRR